MADILIFSDGQFETNFGNFRSMVWVNLTVGYLFYTDNTDPDQFFYLKTVDSGQTWADPVMIDFAAAGNFILGFDVWYERWTPGDTGDLIHISYMSPTSVFGVTHRSLNVTDDVLSAKHEINNTAIFAASSIFPVSITKTRGGNLIGSWRSGNPAPNRGTAKSTDGGVNWVDIDDVSESFGDQVLLYPGNEADDQDAWAVFWDVTANELSLKTYDDSGDSWAETLISASMFDTSDYPQMAGAIRHSDNHLILVAHSDRFPAHDLKAWDINGAGSIIAKTNLFTAQTNQFAVAITLNQNNDDIYVAYYSDIVPISEMRCVYKISSDGGTTWGPETRYGETDRRYAGMWATISVANGSDGRWQPALLVEVNPIDGFTNFLDSIPLSGGPPPSPNPPDPIIPHAVGGQAGTIIYITPDNREYQLVTPHDPGRHVLSFQGLGMPPIEYVRQRGPFQDGETVKDFFLRPRTVQILERQNFCDRSAWWDGRSTLLNELRPNRQTTPDGTTPGRLRFFRTDGTARDLRVFISTGPIFEPRVSTQWDEWSFQELLRFTAYDPVFFSTAQTVSPFVIALDTNLVFPITYPIQFGSGVIDDTLNITYTGTWETFPIITIVGPIETPRIDNNTTGEKLEFTIDIAPGQTVTIDLTEGVKTVTDQDGNNLIGALTTDSDIGSFHIAPDPEAPNGVNVLRFRGTNPNGATSVSLAFFTRFIGM